MQISFPVSVIKVCLTLTLPLWLLACAGPGNYRESPQTAPEIQTSRAHNTVNALLANVDQLMADRKFDAAWSMAERVQNIAPTNPSVWSRMAGIRFAQQSYGQAIQLAKKSNRLAGDNAPLLAHNWRIIQQAALGSGNQALAKQAAEQLRRYSRD